MSERPPIDPASPDFHETLVAYLDGELEADAAHEVEQLVARDPEVEARLRNLERTWKLLDELPRAEVDPSFTRSTVEMAALSIEEHELASGIGSRTMRAALAAVLLLGTALAGFVAAHFWPDANATLLAHLPVIEHLEAYRQTPDIDFLRKLRQESVFALEGGQPSLAVADHRQLVASLSADEKDELHRNYDRFVHLPPDEQRRLELLASSIAADDERAGLDATITAFDHWLEQIPGVERAELMALDGEARLNRVKRLRQEEQRRLSQNDARAFLAWIEERLAKWLSDKPGLKRELESADTFRRRELLSRAVNELRRNRPFVFMNTFFDPSARQALRERLSPPAQRQLDDATPEQRRLLMQSWFIQTLSPPAPGRGQLALPEVDDDELKRFFEHDLDPAERAQLLNMPADQMRRQLLRLYQARQNRRQGASP